MHVSLQRILIQYKLMAWTLSTGGREEGEEATEKHHISFFPFLRKSEMTARWMRGEGKKQREQDSESERERERESDLSEVLEKGLRSMTLLIQFILN